MKNWHLVSLFLLVTFNLSETLAQKSQHDQSKAFFDSLFVSINEQYAQRWIEINYPSLSFEKFEKKLGFYSEWDKESTKGFKIKGGGVVRAKLFSFDRLSHLDSLLGVMKSEGYALANSQELLAYSWMIYQDYNNRTPPYPSWPFCDVYALGSNHGEAQKGEKLHVVLVNNGGDPNFYLLVHPSENPLHVQSNRGFCLLGVHRY